MAKLAKNNGYVCPEITKDGGIYLKDARFSLNNQGIQF
jgi:DNA mismatch repair ATPase MutS